MHFTRQQKSNKKVVDNLPRLAYNATTRLERVANADMAELADAHGSAPDFLLPFFIAIPFVSSLN